MPDKISNPDTYDADDIKVLKGLDGVRKGPAAGGLAGGGPAHRPRSQEPPDAHQTGGPAPAAPLCRPSGRGWTPL